MADSIQIFWEAREQLLRVRYNNACPRALRAMAEEGLSQIGPDEWDIRGRYPRGGRYAESQLDLLDLAKNGLEQIIQNCDREIARRK